MLGKVIRPLLEVPAKLICLGSSPRDLKSRLRSSSLYFIQPLEPGADARADVIEREDALDLAVLPEVLLQRGLLVILVPQVPHCP